VDWKGPPPSSIFLSRDRLYNLESAAVGQDGALPVHEPVKAAHGLDEPVSRPEVEMIRISKNHACSQFPDRFGQQALDRALGAHGHEGGGLHVPVGRFQEAQPGARGGVFPENLERNIGHGRPQRMSMASP
jgi:hypothetical protein